MLLEMNHRILDFSFQLGRVFSSIVFDYDTLENCKGLYDIIFIHREGIQDENIWKNVKEFCKPSTKIVCDVSTESGNIDCYLETADFITKTEDYKFYFILDFELNNFKNLERKNVYILNGYDILFYAYTNIDSDARTFVDSGHKFEYKKNKFMSFNGSMRANRILLLRELNNRNLLSRHLDKSNVSFLLSIDRKFHFNNIKNYLQNLRQSKKLNFTKEDEESILKLDLPILYDNETIDGISHRISGEYEAVLNVVTENTHGMEADDDISKYEITTFTEKTIKPFLATQIPLFIGPPNLENELRKLGFDLFDDLIDYSFEKEKDHYKRFLLKMDELERLLTVDMIGYREKNINRFHNNRRLVSKLSAEGFLKCYNFINNILFDKK